MKPTREEMAASLTETLLERNKLAGENRRLREALQRLYDETADYIRINNLGDVHHNQTMKNAEAALSGEPTNTESLPVCGTCEGRGVVSDAISDLIVDCPECDNPNPPLSRDEWIPCPICESEYDGIFCHACRNQLTVSGEPVPPSQPAPQYDYRLFVSDWLGKHDQYLGYLADMLKDFHELIAPVPPAQLKPGDICPMCERQYHGKMGPGDYSCASCGMGMLEPCDHWKAMEAAAPSAVSPQDREEQ